MSAGVQAVPEARSVARWEYGLTCAIQLADDELKPFVVSEK